MIKFSIPCLTRNVGIPGPRAVVHVNINSDPNLSCFIVDLLTAPRMPVFIRVHHAFKSKAIARVPYFPGFWYRLSIISSQSLVEFEASSALHFPSSVQHTGLRSKLVDKPMMLGSEHATPRLPMPFHPQPKQSVSKIHVSPMSLPVCSSKNCGQFP